ncbi:outer membrane beta-barrel family protein [uncultured Flavobacterium sp.]|uniref:outer membrane beta-barrel family protein n=1 Tax=uncultured Flavobacterium sp. TaxID=165435 RepID=UPI0025F84FD6|nr:outer membrane beta-barrel family protein [uncultured Flavobacterium sp.]
MKIKIITLFAVFFCMKSFSQITENDSINQMEEIVVEGKTKTFIYKNGNVKVDVANSKAIPNTLDLFAKLPKVQISRDKTAISVIGKGNPLLYLDNQRIEMNDLLALSVDDIKSIEIINNPSSKYEAEGRAVILITRKLNRKEGFQTVISETVSFKKRFNNYAGVNSSLKLKKTEFKANFNYNALNVWESNGNSYEIPRNEIVSNYRVVGLTSRNNYIFGGGIYHTINEDDSFSFSINGNLKKDDFDLKTRTNNLANGEQTNLNTLGIANGNRNFINSFLNYNKKINESSSFFAGLQYSNYNTGSIINSSNNYNETNFQPFQKMNQDFNVDVFSGRIDFEKKFVNEIKWEMGGIYSSANANSNLQLQNFEENTNSDSNYNLKEKNVSAYIQLSGTIKKVSWLFGLRVENTNIKGKYADESSDLVDKNYTNFFPKVQIEIPIDSTKTLTFNYAKNISRPNYSETSHGQTYINPYFIFSSNINLNPSTSDEISANFQYKSKSVKLVYYNNKNAMNYGFQYNEAENILIYRPENFDKETVYNLEFSLPFSHHFWTSSNTLSFILNKIEDKSAVIGNSKPYLYYYSNQTFNFKKDWTISLIGWGLSTRNEGVFQRNAIFNLDGAISKTYKNLSCTLSYNNIFKNNIYRENFEVNNVNSKFIFIVDNYEFSVALKYTFGKLKQSIFKEKEINENSDRIK